MPITLRLMPVMVCLSFASWTYLAEFSPQLSRAPRRPMSSPAPVVETGTHWPGIGEFSVLSQLGYHFAITTVGSSRNSWDQAFNTAEASGLRLIVGLHPSPYRYTSSGWTIDPAGVAFLQYAASRSHVVKAIFVFNEPYWTNPSTGQTSVCGVYSAEQLRALRTTIRGVWPDAKIFHDIGQPSVWAPGGSLRADNPCIGNKYADATGVADMVGIWFYPFDNSGYKRTQALSVLKQEIDYVTKSMKALPIVDNQAFKCSRCGEAGRWPTAQEMIDYNCATRALAPHAISWYAWRQGIYEDFLANHPEMWQHTTASACQPR